MEFCCEGNLSFVYMSGTEKYVVYRRELYYCYCDNYEQREMFKRGVILNENKLEGMNSFKNRNY
jgi:hypothetical protein